MITQKSILWLCVRWCGSVIRWTHSLTPWNDGTTFKLFTINFYATLYYYKLYSLESLHSHCVYVCVLVYSPLKQCFRTFTASALLARQRYRALDMIFPHINLLLASSSLCNTNIICFLLENCEIKRWTVVCVGLEIDACMTHDPIARIFFNGGQNQTDDANPFVWWSCWGLRALKTHNKEGMHTTARPFSNWLETSIIKSNKPQGRRPAPTTDAGDFDSG